MSERKMDAYERAFPHLKRSWLYRKWFLLRYDVAMTVNRIQTWWLARMSRR